MEVAKVMKRFLIEEGGPVDNILMSCLKPKVGSGTILEDCPKHLPDESLFDIHNIIDVPLEVIPKGSIHFDVKYYNEIKDLFNLGKDINRNDI